MKQSLETADRIVKLVLAISIILLYLANAISGPFATASLILAVLVLVIFIFKALIKNTD